MNVANALLFQLTWFASVIGGATGAWAWALLPLLGLGVAAKVRATWQRDLCLVALLVPIGWCLDTAWSLAGILDFSVAAGGLASGGVAPLWIALLWAGVALTINHSLAIFAAHPLVGAAFAAVSAPLCYLGGERLGAVAVPEAYALTVVAVGWFVLFYLVFRFLSRPVSMNLATGVAG